MSARRELFAGVMSGTSLDGVDAVLADFSPGAAPCTLLAATHIAFPTDLRHELLALQAATPDEIVRMARAANALADLYAHGAAQRLPRGRRSARTTWWRPACTARRCGTGRRRAGRCRSTIRRASPNRRT